MRRLFERCGAAVAPLAPDGLEVVLPLDLQQALALPELARLGFGAELPQGAERIGLDALSLERLASALGDRGRFAHCLLEASVPPAAGAEELLVDGVRLSNGVYRLLDSEPAWARYWIFGVRYSARSDEKRDGLLRLGVNLGSASPLDGSAAAVMHRASLAAPAPSGPSVAYSALPPPWPPARLSTLFERGLRQRVGTAVAPFVAGLERRLARDLRRVHRYYSQLACEAQERATRPGAEAGLAANQLQAIAREQDAKVADLERRYRVVVEVDVVQWVEVVAPVRRFHLLLKRRKGERRFALDWSAVTRQLEPLPCEHTYAPAGPRGLCDAALHMLSPGALAPCSDCGRVRCFACHPRACARCGGGAAEASR